MKLLVQHQLILLILCGFLYFTNLGSAYLFDEDEPKNAACGREMFVQNNWIVPTFNDELRPHKPIMLYWEMLLCYLVFGVNEFAARLPSAIMSIGTVLCTYHIGRMLWKARYGFWAAVILATSPMFVTISRAAVPEATLVFFCTLGAAVLAASATGLKNRTLSTNLKQHENTLNIPFYPSTTLGWVALYATMSLGVLAKGPVGILLPGIALWGLGVLYCWQRNVMLSHPLPTWRGKVIRLVKQFPLQSAFKLIPTLRPLTAILTLIAVAGPWYVLVGLQTEGAWLVGFFGVHNVHRFLHPMENHSGPFFYYVLAILAGMFPWSILLPWTLYHMVKRMSFTSVNGAIWAFLTCWFGVYFVFYSMASTKLPHYISPAYPAMSLALAAMFIEWVDDKRTLPVPLARVAFGSMIAAGVSLIVGLAIAASIFLPGSEYFGLLGIIPLLGGIAAWVCYESDRQRWIAPTLSLTAVGFLTVLFMILAPEVNPYQNSKPLADLNREFHQSEDSTLVSYRYFQPTLVYYARRPVPFCADLEQAVDEYQKSTKVGYVMRERDLDEFKSQFPAPVKVIAKQQAFLKKHSLLLVVPEPQVAAKPSMKSELSR